MVEQQIGYQSSPDVLSRPSRRSTICEHGMDGEAILFDPETRRTYLLNQTAFQLWRRCDGYSTLHDLAEAQTAMYDVDFETALDHVQQTVAYFAETNLLHPDSDV